jgi:CDP-diacylglycerol--glycerol-3-phosphate 3-phosphatidyltransferase
MGGVAWYLIGRHEGHLAVLPLAVLGVTALVSYERAKAESLGLSAKGGLMERAERMILLGVAFLDSAFVIPVLYVMLGLISVTAIARFAKVWNEASGKDVVVRRRVAAWREGKVDSRWRSWREGAAVPRGGLNERSGVPVGRWRARRQEALSSRSGRTLRARRALRPHASATDRSSGAGRTRTSRGPSS